MTTLKRKVVTWGIVVVLTFLMAGAGLLVKQEHEIEKTLHSGIIHTVVTPENTKNIVGDIDLSKNATAIKAMFDSVDLGVCHQLDINATKLELTIRVKYSLYNLTQLVEMISWIVPVPLVIVQRSSMPARHYTFLMNAITEAVKMLMSFALYFIIPASATQPEGTAAPLQEVTPDLSSRGKRVWWGFLRSWVYCVPAILYVIDNNLFFVVIALIGPVKFHLFNNIKVIITAVLFRLFLRRILTTNQWVCMIILVTGVIVAQQADIIQKGQKDTCDSEEEAEVRSIGGIFSSVQVFQGFLMVVVMAACASFANIWAEYVYKKDVRKNFYLQNVQLYVYGTLINGMVLLVRHWDDMQVHGAFLGWTKLTPWIIFVQAVYGICIAHVLKMLDNIANVFVHAAAFLLTVVASMFLFSFEPSILFFCGCIVTFSAIFIYHTSHDPKEKAKRQTQRPTRPRDSENGHGNDFEMSGISPSSSEDSLLEY